MDDTEQEWWRPVLTGLGALVAISLAVGLVVGLGVLLVTQGLSGTDTTTSSSEPTLVIPDSAPRDDDSDLYLNPTPLGGTAEGETTESPEAEASPDRKDKKKKQQLAQQIVLSVSPTRVSPMERVNLTGVYRRGEGAQLEVQRREGGSWQTFPTSASVSGGTFATFVQTGQPGANRFRVVDVSTGRASNPVTVNVG